MTGTPALFALTTAGTISREPLGTMASAPTPRWTRFSTICSCAFGSISRSGASTTSVSPRLSAAACAPLTMSTKNGLFIVFGTSATTGFDAASLPRLQATSASAANNWTTLNRRGRGGCSFNRGGRGGRRGHQLIVVGVLCVLRVLRGSNEVQPASSAAKKWAVIAFL